VPKELIELARTVRKQHASYPELRIQREVGDALERARSNISGLDRTFGHDVHERVKDDLAKIV